MQRSYPTAPRANLPDTWPLFRHTGWVLGLAILVVLVLPALTADRSPLTSDESLYLAEGLNLTTGKGFTYPSGDTVVHRAPLYPLALAAALKLGGPDLDSAYYVSRLFFVANVLLTFALARMLFSTWGGFIAAGLAAGSPYLRGLGTTLFLDPALTTFVLAMLLVFWLGQRDGSPKMTALAGALLGAGFLVKESAFLFLPLPLLYFLWHPGKKQQRAHLVAWYGAFGAATAWWWIWVYFHSQRLFLLGDPSWPVLGLMSACVIGAILGIGFVILRPARVVRSTVHRLGAVGLLSAWVAIMFLAVERSGWSFESDYPGNLPHYFITVFAGNVQPSFLVAIAWIWVVWQFLRAKGAHWLLVTNVLLFSPFVLIVADRGLSLRDLLPLVYLSYVALGGLAAWLVTWADGIDETEGTRFLRSAALMTGGLVLGVLLVRGYGDVSQRSIGMSQDDWHNRISTEVALWLSDTLEPGERILSSRLYYSHIHFLTGGQFQIHQLPTVEARLGLRGEEAQPITRLSTLFRWEDHLLPPDRASGTWIYLTRYPFKGYFIALAEEDLLGAIHSRAIDWVLLASSDAGFSPRALALYFDDNPAFALAYQLEAGPRDEVRIYRVNRELLGPWPIPALVSPAVNDFLVGAIGGEAEAHNYLQRLNPAGFVLITDQ
jgi:4-amino-4-deoxy-L-arabinose transferase-like glycosyltransferase